MVPQLWRRQSTSTKVQYHKVRFRTYPRYRYLLNSVSDPDSSESVFPCPDPGLGIGYGSGSRQAKIVPRNFMFEEFSVRLELLLEAECRWRFFDKNVSFFIVWICIQKQPRSGSGCSNTTGSGSKFIESGSETLIRKHLKALRYCKMYFLPA